MFSKNLTSLRKEKGLSQYELADRLGFSRGKLANYEQGTRQPDFDTLKLIADYFEVPTDYLLGRDALSSEKQVTTLGARLKLLRGTKTQEEVSNSLGLSRARYSHYENDRVEPDTGILIKLAEYYKVSTDYLLGRDTSSSEEQVSFNEFIQDEDLREWYKNLGQAPEEDLADLKVFFDTFIAKKHTK